ncbi:Hypothetical protein PMT_2306 [Prochlorococcus marinus str. MIT 9313]|uniref:Uncharacterized protein n=1 Tax=Prochlorococcus marinus (strain MIT 9313) TaxID=74547 RepID=B9ERE0_PROMM|nr:Hypothetical protein PMT_2306 [Prochlorococcus marinus str. MIT 9313]
MARSDQRLIQPQVAIKPLPKHIQSPSQYHESIAIINSTAHHPVAINGLLKLLRDYVCL